MDYRVEQAQRWVNATYSGVLGYIPCPEDGHTGWSTMYAFTRALQFELGITTLSSNFGSGTMAALQAFGPISAGTSNVNMRTIVEAALYCKGYSGGAIDGGWGDSTQGGLTKWRRDMGFSSADAPNAVGPKEMKALLTMDAYILTYGGDPLVQQIQRWMNANYAWRRDYYIVPCDGYFSRDVQRGMILAIQYAIGMADGVANGNFGPGTRQGIRDKAYLSVGSVDASVTAPWVSLFKAALIFNGRDGVVWDGTFTAATSQTVLLFQEFCRLTASGTANYETWCSLLVSTGDPDRVGKACDCMTPINDARAQQIRSAGYETVGRYITGGTQKLLTASEVDVIFRNGLNFVPIYQEYNNALSYFDEAQGRNQGEKAFQSATNLGLPTGAIIYFSVDYDAMADEVRTNIIPFFRGVAGAFADHGDKFSVGIYASRNICSMVSDAGYAISSFVSGMSIGFSGNLGYPLPSNWAFDQIKTLTLGAGAPGEIEIDNDIKSDRDPGISSLTKAIDQNAAFLTWVRWIEARAFEWWNRGNQGNTQQQLTAFYLRTYFDQRYNDASFAAVSGGVDNDFIAYCSTAKGRPDPAPLRDPSTGLLCDIQHLGASLGSVYMYEVLRSGSSVNVGDFGAWAGDLISLAADCYNAGVSDEDSAAWARGRMASVATSFSGSDLTADVDALTVGLATKGQELTISDAVDIRYADTGASHDRFGEFVAKRFGSKDGMDEAASQVFLQTSDLAFLTFREGLWGKATGTSFTWADLNHRQLLLGVARGMSDAVWYDYAV